MTWLTTIFTMPSYLSLTCALYSGMNSNLDPESIWESLMINWRVQTSQSWIFAKFRHPLANEKLDFSLVKCREPAGRAISRTLLPRKSTLFRVSRPSSILEPSGNFTSRKFVTAIYDAIALIVLSPASARVFLAKGRSLGSFVPDSAWWTAIILANCLYWRDTLFWDDV